MVRTSRLLLNGAAACLFSSFAFAFSPSFPYGTEKKVRGVNLGGWLVLEPWITPSIFDNTGDPRIIDEYTFGQYQDRNTAEQTLKDHRDTFITEADFVAIAAAGLNHVRVPIGYWAWDVSEGEPYIQGQLPYLRNAVTWARNSGLKLIIDLEGVPGSQNGFVSSGQKLPDPTWQSNPTNIDRTNAVLQRIAEEFGPEFQTVAAIAALNEPAGFYSPGALDAAKAYWLSSYKTIRDSSANTLQIIHDAFQPFSYWDGWEQKPDYEGVAMDTHIYEIYSVSGNQMTDSQHIQSACSHADDIQSFNSNQLLVIVGSWSPVMTDCAKYLNGRGVGSRYDGTYPGSTRVGSCKGLTGSSATFSESFKESLRQMWEAQVITFEKGSGWVQWTWKTEQTDEWSYQAGLKNGWIPLGPTERKYPNICG